MDQPSSSLADRYDLDLSDQWKDWFDVQLSRLMLPGCFRFPLTAADLCQDRPSFLWPGFMQPDTLPLLGNGYGDWICARVTENNHLGELIHWFHGGGDWIPVGGSLAEAVLHDAIDQLRPIQKQMLRGAAESIPQSEHQSLAPGTAGYNEFAQWLDRSLLVTGTGDRVSTVLKDLCPENYLTILKQLIGLEISLEACSCDLIEYIINQALANDQQQLSELPRSDWSMIESHCASIIRRRSDIGWSFALHGMSREFISDLQGAQHSWFQGRLASSFSGQSVRLRLHHFENRFRKCCVARLANTRSELPGSMRDDLYLQQFWSCEANCINETIQRFWRQQGTEAMSQGRFELAYHFFYRAGWDLGAAKLSDYYQLLSDLRSAAIEAGWTARASVIKTYLDCHAMRSD